MHELIEQHPKYRKITEARADSRRRQAVAEAGVQKIQAEYEFAFREALEAGKTPPPAPPSPGDIQAVYQSEQAGIDREMTKFWTENAEELIDRLQEAELPAMAKVADLAAQLDAAAREVRQLFEANRHVLQTLGQVGTYGGLGRPIYQGHVDTPAVVVAARNGWSFIGEPLAPAMNLTPGLSIGVGR